MSEWGEDFREVLCWKVLLNLPQFPRTSLLGETYKKVNETNYSSQEKLMEQITAPTAAAALGASTSMQCLLLPLAVADAEMFLHLQLAPLLVSCYRHNLDPWAWRSEPYSPCPWGCCTCPFTITVKDGRCRRYHLPPCLRYNSNSTSPDHQGQSFLPRS